MWLTKRFPDRVSGLLPRILFLAAGTVAVILLAREENVPNPVVWACGDLMLGALVASMLWMRAGRYPVVPGPERSRDPGLWRAGRDHDHERMGSLELHRLRRQSQMARVRGADDDSGHDWNRGGFIGNTTKTMNDFGSPMALMLFPYWTQEAFGSMEGLFFESSLSTPFHFLNQAEMSKDPSSPDSGPRLSPVRLRTRASPICRSSGSTTT